MEDAYRFPYITSKILSTLRGQIVPTFHKRVNKINKGLEGNFGIECLMPNILQYAAFVLMIQKLN